jgi:hypothetical protein
MAALAMFALTSPKALAFVMEKLTVIKSRIVRGAQTSFQFWYMLFPIKESFKVFNVEKISPFLFIVLVVSVSFDSNLSVNISWLDFNYPHAPEGLMKIRWGVYSLMEA